MTPVRGERTSAPLTIKDEEVHRLARRLAALTGESVTEAVRAALKERIARERRRQGAKARAEELLEIGRRCAAGLKAPATDHADLLYDERGLPR